MNEVVPNEFFEEYYQKIFDVMSGFLKDEFQVCRAESESRSVTLGYFKMGTDVFYSRPVNESAKKLKGLLDEAFYWGSDMSNEDYGDILSDFSDMLPDGFLEITDSVQRTDIGTTTKITFKPQNAFS